MKMPKFKPTTWKLQYCVECKSMFNYYCGKKGHTKIERDNVPFFVPEMKITSFGKWSRLMFVKTKESYVISKSNIGRVILGCDIKAGGLIHNQWWIWTKVGEFGSLKWLPNDE